MLSNTSKYAIRSLLYLSLHGDNNLLNSREIAQKLNVPEPFLGKIMQTLAKKKILSSQRGLSGGFKFLKKPSEIYFLDIIEIFDGLDSFENCLLGVRLCTESPEYANNCPFHNRLDPVLTELKNILSTTTIEDYTKQIEDIKDNIFL